MSSKHWSELRVGDKIVLPEETADGEYPSPRERCEVLELERASGESWTPREGGVMTVCVIPADRIGDDDDGLRELCPTLYRTYETWEVLDA